MKYKLLSVNTPANVINIGDYIQALASHQFLPHMDGFVSREALNSYNGEECKIVMNGWYMHNPQNWPPSERIKPLFVAFHMNTYTRNAMFSEAGIQYFRRNSPIGCRDKHTVELLKNHAIDAYFTGCMTLTLGEKYHDDEKEDTVYFVDAYYKNRWNKLDLIKNIPTYIIHKKIIDSLAKKMYSPLKGMKKKLRIVDFYKQYSKYFTYETLLKAQFIQQEGAFYNEKFNNDEELLQEAERLVRLYARAKLVVTSRIHCALPCLGLGTPVVYVENANQDDISLCRMDGLKQLFNIMSWKDGKLTPQFKLDNNNKLSTDNPPINKTAWETIADQLKTTVRAFIDK